jgi:hypothetical protein
LLTVTLSTDFLSMSFVQRAHTCSIDLGDIHMNFDNLQSSIGPHGTAGPQGPQGEKGEKDDTGASAPTRDLSIRPVKGNVAENGFEKSIASCDSDEILTGRGYEQTGPMTVLYYIANQLVIHGKQKVFLLQMTFLHTLKHMLNVNN